MVFLPGSGAGQGDFIGCFRKRYRFILVSPLGDLASYGNNTRGFKRSLTQSRRIQSTNGTNTDFQLPFFHFRDSPYFLQVSVENQLPGERRVGSATMATWVL